MDSSSDSFLTQFALMAIKISSAVELEMSVPLRKGWKSVSWAKIKCNIEGDLAEGNHPPAFRALQASGVAFGDFAVIISSPPPQVFRVLCGAYLAEEEPCHVLPALHRVHLPFQQLRETSEVQQVPPEPAVSWAHSCLIFAELWAVWPCSSRWQHSICVTW